MTQPVHADVETGAPLPEEPPPQVRLTPRQWMEQNLFGTWYDTVLTVVFGIGIGVVVFFGLRFILVTARWEIIRVGLTSLMVGLFPRPELWRVWVALFVIVLSIGFAVGGARRMVLAEEEDEAGSEAEGLGLRPRVDLWDLWRRLWPVLTFLAVILGFSESLQTALWLVLLLVGTYATYYIGSRLPRSAARYWLLAGLVGMVGAFGIVIWFGGVGWDQWGGLMLTLFLAVAAILLSFPLGVGAALGRRSSLPGISLVSVAYIELIRGVPLITLLLTGQLMLGLFFPRDVVPGLVVRSIIMLTLFTGAYVAEIVRGGLQGVPQGQYEAAQALGLSPTQMTRRIVLPQALRNVIPAMVGQFISLFKDTSLVSVIALTDLLRVARFQLPAQGDFAGQGLFAETMLFAGFVYWVFAYTMSRESQRLERRLGVGER